MYEGGPPLFCYYKQNSRCGSLCLSFGDSLDQSSSRYVNSHRMYMQASTEEPDLIFLIISA